MLTDAQWAMLEPLMEHAVRKARPRRRTCAARFEAILWRHQNGAKWRAVPAELGPWWRAAQIFIRWARLGVWERLLKLVQERGDPARDDVPRRHQRAGPPEGGRGSPKRGSQAQRDDREALGRSRGGYGTKACVIADGSAAPSRFASHPVRRMNCRMPSRCWSDCRMCQPGSWQIAATPVIAFASTSGAWRTPGDPVARPMRRRSPVRTGSTTTAMLSSGSGPG